MSGSKSSAVATAEAAVTPAIRQVPMGPASEKLGATGEATSASSTLTWTNERLLAHLVGLWMFGAFLTVPAGVKTATTQLGLQIYFSEVFAVAALFFMTRIGKSLAGTWPILLAFAWGITVGMYRWSGGDDLYRDGHPVACLAFAAVLGTGFFRAYQFRILAIYLNCCLWVSAVVVIGITTGALTTQATFRSSFDSAGAADIGRLVTNSHIMAAVWLSVLIGLAIQRQVKRKTVVLGSLPAIIILAVAGTRLTLVFIVVPILAALLSSKVRGASRIIFAGLGWLAATVAALGLVLVASGFNASPILKYVQNTFLRALGTLTNSTQTDSSLAYRTLENSHALPVIRDHFFTGIGFGQRYTTSLLQAGNNSWLAVYGPYWVHNSYLWLALKIGVPVALTVFVWILVQIKKPNQDPLARALKWAVLAILCITPAWGTVGGWPDCIMLGICVGALVRFRRERSEAELRQPNDVDSFSNS